MEGRASGLGGRGVVDCGAQAAASAPPRPLVTALERNTSVSTGAELSGARGGRGQAPAPRAYSRRVCGKDCRLQRGLGGGDTCLQMPAGGGGGGAGGRAWGTDSVDSNWGGEVVRRSK
eukprot:6205590-Pleurochrysis_carterae.AAC.2